MKMPHIVIAGNFSFEASSANSLRVQGIVQSLRMGGAKVTVVDNVTSLNSEHQIEREIDHNLRLISVNEYINSPNNTYIRSLRGLFIGNMAADAMLKRCNNVDAIIIYGPHPGYIHRFRKIAAKLNVPLILDIVEWYEREDLPGGPFGPFAIANEYSMRHLSAKADGVIVISRRLEAHYKALGCRTLRVPPLFRCASAPADKFSAQDGRLHLCYAGSIGRKEAFGLILKRLQHAHERGVDFAFHVIGPAESEIRSHAEGHMPSFLQPSAGRFKSYGKLPNADAVKIIASSDFSLVFRPLRKANQFGFPSKLAESMCLGTPALANNFSDLTQTLTGHLGGLLASSLSADAIDLLLDRASSLSCEDKRDLSASALRRAHDLFAHSNYTDALLELCR